MSCDSGTAFGAQLPAVVSHQAGPVSLASLSTLAVYEAAGVSSTSAGTPGAIWERASGCNVIDVDGNLYLDMTASYGVAAVGYSGGWVQVRIDHDHRTRDRGCSCRHSVLRRRHRDQVKGGAAGVRRRRLARSQPAGRRRMGRRAGRRQQR